MDDDRLPIKTSDEGKLLLEEPGTGWGFDNSSSPKATHINATSKSGEKYAIKHENEFHKERRQPYDYSRRYSRSPTRNKQEKPRNNQYDYSTSSRRSRSREYIRPLP